MTAVSIIMNCLNCARDLPAALESVKKQTFQDYEIIFWDNCSTDQSAVIAQNFGPKLRYFKSAATVPLGEARNMAIKEAKGEFIAFLDCDDLWQPDKLLKQIELFRANPKLGLVCTDTEIYNGHKVLYRLFDRSKPERGYVFAELMTRQWISMSSAMIRRKALDRLLEKENYWFDKRLNVCEEADVFYRIAHDWELDYVDDPLTVWRVHAGNTTFKKFDEVAEETLIILSKLRKMYPDFDQKYIGLADVLKRRAIFQKSVALWRNGKGAQARATIAPYIGNSNKYRLFWFASFLPGSSFDYLSRLYFNLPSFLRR